MPKKTLFLDSTDGISNYDSKADEVNNYHT